MKRLIVPRSHRTTNGTVAPSRSWWWRRRRAGRPGRRASGTGRRWPTGRRSRSGSGRRSCRSSRRSRRRRWGSPGRPAGSCRRAPRRPRGCRSCPGCRRGAGRGAGGRRSGPRAVVQTNGCCWGPEKIGPADRVVDERERGGLGLAAPAGGLGGEGVGAVDQAGDDAGQPAVRRRAQRTGDVGRPDPDAHPVGGEAVGHGDRHERVAARHLVGPTGQDGDLEAVRAGGRPTGRSGAGHHGRRGDQGEPGRPSTPAGPTRRRPPSRRCRLAHVVPPEVGPTPPGPVRGTYR